MAMKIKLLNLTKIFLIAVAILGEPIAFAQGLVGAQGGITAADLSALRSGSIGVGGAMAGSGQFGAASGVSGLLAIPVPTSNADEESDSAKPESKNSKKQTGCVRIVHLPGHSRLFLRVQASLCHTCAWMRRPDLNDC